jgi:phosphoenolpyruvate carboxykinase (GTP)
VEGTAKAQKTAIGNLPTPDALDLSGLNLSAEDVKQLLEVDAAGWKNEVADVAANYAKFGSHLPKALNNQLDELKKRLG